jgi:hypothetical protein
MGERDDTRDIAIKAKASADGAHKRLDGINGQIARLANAVEGTNTKLDEALHNPEHGMRAELAALRTDVKVTIAKVAIVTALVSLIFGAGTSAIASHYLNQNTPTPNLQSQASASR